MSIYVYVYINKFEKINKITDGIYYTSTSVGHSSPFRSTQASAAAATATADVILCQIYFKF